MCTRGHTHTRCVLFTESLSLRPCSRTAAARAVTSASDSAEPQRLSVANNSAVAGVAGSLASAS
jgi:hypothetical protein